MNPSEVNELQPDTTARRRASRVLVSLPVVISGNDSSGSRFEARGETRMVNSYGAKIWTSQALSSGMDLQIRLRSRSRSARVVWANAKANEYGVELKKPENFWGIYFPPNDWQEGEPQWEEAQPKLPILGPTPQRRVISDSDVATLPPSADSTVQAPITAEPAQAVPQDTSIRPDGACISLPWDGVEAFVRGTSVLRAPFQEKGILLPVNREEASILVTPLVDVGTVARVIFPGERVVKTKTVAVSTVRERGKWRIWLKFDLPIRVV